MTTQPLAPYPDWKAPSADGAWLIWPETNLLIQQTLANHERLAQAHNTQIQNTPLPQLRTLARQSIGHDDQLPLIATGHQTELHHPGVWAKNPLISLLADQMKGHAYHLAVDTDAPKHLSLRWPGHSLPLTDDPAVSSAAWSSLLKAPSTTWQIHLRQAAEEDRSLAYGTIGEPMLGKFFDAFERSSMTGNSLDHCLSAAMRDVDATLGVRYRTLIASRLWDSVPYLALVHHIIARAAEFSGDYNTALADYRRRTGTQSKMRPMPDLFVGEESVELPFWLDDLSTGIRSRPSVFATDAGFTLQLVSGAEFVFDRNAPAIEAAEQLSAFLSRSRQRLSPRALTLTMFVRLLLADQFVHGIGGGRYDQVTDQIIARHFKIEPPTFSVTTATLYFPTALNRERVCMPCLARDGHRLKHGVLGESKLEQVKQIAALPRRSAQRGEIFARMHQARRSALATDANLIKWERDFSEAQLRLQEEKTLFDRELFYAVQPKARLMELIEKYSNAMRKGSDE
jgi:hypothetical protein